MNEWDLWMMKVVNHVELCSRCTELGERFLYTYAQLALSCEGWDE